MSFHPKNPLGPTSLENWLRLALDKIKRFDLVETPELGVRRSAMGQAYYLKQQAAAGGAKVQQYVVNEVRDNYYRGRSWDGSAAGTDDVYIARPFTHRRGNFDPAQGGPPGGIAFDSDGDAFTATYSYESATKRTKTISSVAEVEVLIPYFKVDFDLIYAVRVSEPLSYGVAHLPLVDPNGQPITLLDLNVEGRAWAFLQEAGN